ncbi:hypothetical protein NBRC116602_29920 [Hyphomicrobiales bacterium 4NK60-0047b]
MTKNNFAQDISFAETQSVNFESTVLAKPSQLKPNPDIELCNRKINTHIKPSEYNCFISHIGRQPVSKVLRQLILDFNKQQNEENKITH